MGSSKDMAIVTLERRDGDKIKELKSVSKGIKTNLTVLLLLIAGIYHCSTNEGGIIITLILSMMFLFDICIFSAQIFIQDELKKLKSKE